MVVSSVDCGTKTVGVTIDNRQTPPRRPRSTTFMVRTTYAGTLSFSRYLDEAQEVYRLTVPVAMRPDGRLIVTGTVPGGTPSQEALYSEALDTTCAAPTPTPTTPGSAAPTTPGAAGPGSTATPAATTEQLSATGGSALPALLLASFLTAAGIVLIRLARGLGRAAQRGGS
ncbi:hypothetical protein SAMN05216199_2599 [Pedococcus cremeus]|uniref:Uncharacterized protein n=1 Tax=Pedococcus cremeus TaxID=587636 RepID=A0A1H9VVZ8_9MICO|nr:hypothetical protein [Pedococcus cremeus]SES25782.1 hypothetical protein SAMN05216199_2599 [Pedococcus cremeus]